MCRAACTCQQALCVFGECKFCALLSSLFSCSRAPLNMSDVLERDITTGAEREASFLSLPSPLYITSYWHQSLFILSSTPRSLSPILLSLRLYFPSFYPLLFMPWYFSQFVAICCSVFPFQLVLAHRFTDCNASIAGEDTVAKFKVRSCVNQSWQRTHTHGSARVSIRTLTHRERASFCRVCFLCVSHHRLQDTLSRCLLLPRMHSKTPAFIAAGSPH